MPFGAVIPGVAVIQAGIVIVVIAAVADGVGFPTFYHTPAQAVKKKPPGSNDLGGSLGVNSSVVCY